ncbi:MAG: hypothetical protein J5659_02470 [Clostridia bacterium]|nr:hypothetical protein [Clostridia bacterium]
MANILEESFTKYEGKEKVFSLNGKNLVIPAGLDTFIHYRTKFRELAKVCSDNALQEYNATVNNLDTFMEHFPKIYHRHLNVVAGKAIDVLISEGVYNFSAETFTKRHLDSICVTLNDYETMQQSIEETQELNYNNAGGIVKGLGSFFTRNSGSFVQGFVDGVTDSLADETKSLTAEQKIELYQRIIPHKLLQNTFVDYWNVVITMVEILQENNKDFCLNDCDDVNDIEAISQSIKNPNFPQERIIDVLFDYILKNPTEERVYKLLQDKFGITEETSAIFDYFIYPDFANDIYSENDFTKEESLSVSKNSQSEQSDSNHDTSTDYQTIETQSSADNSGGDILKKGLKIGAGVLAAGLALGAMGNQRTSGGGLFGNKISGNSNKKDLFGTAVCQRCQSSTTSMNRYTCIGCPARARCTQNVD